MDVQCERCKTEYEFDDALVSERGTTVRCTTCGHQFKVRRTDAAALQNAGDRWIVRPDEGPPLTFVTLRDLQQAILTKQVRRSDWLQRGMNAPRPIGSITELEPFFEGRTSSRPPPGETAPPAEATAPVVFPKRAASWGDGQGGDPQPTASAYLASTAARPDSYSAGIPPMRHKIDTLRPPLDAHGAAPPPPRANVEPTPAASPSLTPITDAGRIAPTPSAAAAPAGTPALVASDPFGLPPPTRPVRRSMIEDDLDVRQPPPSSYDDPYSAPRRRRVGGWIVAMSLVLAVGVVGWAVAKPYLVGRDAKATPPPDPRAQAFLAQGERALVDGDIDLAQQTFDKASVLAEKDPRVLLDQARVTAAKADVPWLKLRVLKADALDEIRTTHAQLDDLVPRARRQAEDAVAAAPDDPVAVRANIDALRLAGDCDGARSNVSRLGSLSTQPETAYVLAALDLAEPTPVWATVIERLRSAAVAEGTAGRVRAALVYALGQSGDVAGARAELVKIDAAARPYPLLPSLHAFLDATGDRSRGPAAAGSGTKTPAARPTEAAAVTAPPPAARGAAPAAAGADQGLDVSDPRVGMQSAATAIKKGDFTRARQIYQGIVDRSPNDSEAVSGLGDVARLQGDPSGAVAAYKRAIAINPSYLPALLGLADTQWVRGERAAAAKTYTDVVDRFPEGTYPSYVPKRIEAAAASAKVADPAPAASDEHTE